VSTFKTLSRDINIILSKHGMLQFFLEFCGYHFLWHPPETAEAVSASEDSLCGAGEG